MVELRCGEGGCDRRVLIYDGEGGYWCADHGDERAKAEGWAVEAKERTIDGTS